MKPADKGSKWFSKGLFSNLLLGKISIPLYFLPLLTLYTTLLPLVNFNVALYKCFCQIIALLDVDSLGISSALGLTTNFVGVD